MAQKAIFSVVNNRRLFHSMLRAASVVQKPLEEGRLHPPSAVLPVGHDEFRSLPAIAEVPFRDTNSSKIEQTAKRTEKAAFYAGCLIDFAYPEMGESLVKILNKAGIEVVFPEGQTCCGAPARFSGAYEVAARNASDNIEALLADDVQYVVSACPTCTVALKKDFISTFVSLGQTEKIPRARELAEKVVDFASLVTKLVEEGRLKFKPGQRPRADDLSRFLPPEAHAQCLSRAARVAGQGRLPAQRDVRSRYLLRHGRSYSLKLPEISAPILDRKLCHIENTKAPLVAMDCPGCVMQIRGGLDKRGYRPRRHSHRSVAG